MLRPSPGTVGVVAHQQIKGEGGCTSSTATTSLALVSSGYDSFGID
jgi:hypothetical protein